jgi:methionine aminopeptidase
MCGLASGQPADYKSGMYDDADEDMFDTRPVTKHSAADYDGMRKTGALAASVLDAMVDFVRPGITTEDINTECHKMIIAAGAIPAPLGYRGFPKSVCTSVNHVVCHGIPRCIETAKRRYREYRRDDYC